MTSKEKVAYLVGEDKAQFRDVIRVLSAGKRINGETITSRLIAERAGCSASTLSLVGIGERSLSEKLADTLADLLGGTAERWEEVYRRIKSDTSQSVDELVEYLNGGKPHHTGFGLQFTRIMGSDLQSLLHDMKGRPPAVGQLFAIDSFDERRLRKTSYDTVIGSLENIETGAREEVGGEVKIEKESTFLARTKESFTVPEWMEAEVGAPASLAQKGLVVSCGPIIDPGFDDFLTATIYNPMSKPVFLKPDQPFLTIRFSLMSDL